MAEPFERSKIWAESLAERDNDRDSTGRNRLRAAYLAMRANCATLAGEIAISSPDLTVHDITHMDALWETLDEISTPEISLSPTEAFVLGGAFLIRDLGMAASAYDDSAAFANEAGRYDLIAFLLRKRFGRAPTTSERSNPPADIRQEAEGLLIRESHAKRAQKLAVHGFTSSDGHTVHLISDDELRIRLGVLIGQIAHSHWWNVDRLPQEFDSRPLSLPGFPRDWIIDRLKVACLMRLADAAQIDIRRAPPFLRILRKPTGKAAHHWRFQERLERPIRVGSRLVYSSLRPFERAYAQDWWQAYDLLRDVDGEFRKVNALLYDLNLPAIPVMGIAGVETPERFRQHVPTEDWVPIDANIKVSDIPHLVQQIGGYALYGNHPYVGLRELVQNSIDAISVRSHLDKRGAPGRILIRLYSGDGDGDMFLEVDDNGCGMSREVLADTLLDFGSSLWNSDKLRDEYPGLLSSEWESVGRFGIGFYAVFLLGDEVIVRTNKYDQAAAATSVLEFKHGTLVRPLLRNASTAEQLLHGGTVVTVKLRHDPDDEKRGLFNRDSNLASTLLSLCQALFPCISVDLLVEDEDYYTYVLDEDEEPLHVVTSNDWQSIEPSDLFDRIYVRTLEYGTDEGVATALTHFKHLARPLHSHAQLVGRLAISTTMSLQPYSETTNYALLCVGGIFASEISGFSGVIAGTPSRAARDEARVLADDAELTRWANEQSALLGQLSGIGQKDLLAATEQLRTLGATPNDLPLCIHKSALVCPSQLLEWLEGNYAALLIDDDLVQVFEPSSDQLSLKHPVSGVDLKLYDECIVANESSWSNLLSSETARTLRPKYEFSHGERGGPWRTMWQRICPSAMGDVVRLAARAWRTSIDDIMQSNTISRDLHPVGELSTGETFTMPLLE